jgi:hypothetical protein
MPGQSIWIAKGPVVAELESEAAQMEEEITSSSAPVSCAPAHRTEPARK